MSTKDALLVTGTFAVGFGGLIGFSGVADWYSGNLFGAAFGLSIAFVVLSMTAFAVSAGRDQPTSGDVDANAWRPVTTMPFLAGREVCTSLPQAATSGPAIVYDNDTGEALFEVWYEFVSQIDSKMTATHWRPIVDPDGDVLDG